LKGDNSKEQKIISSTRKPSDWKPIGKNSPIELTVNYIFEHDPKFAAHNLPHPWGILFICPKEEYI
jgi:hypothetical protein